MHRLAALPSDALALLLSFLSGFDLLPLSHADRRLYTQLLARNGDAWRRRLPAAPFAGPLAWMPAAREPPPRKRWKAKYKKLLTEVKGLVRADAAAESPSQTSWKALYLTSASLRFPGWKQGHAVERKAGGAVKLWNGVHHAWNGERFSFDLWFALLPTGDGSATHYGGVLLGAQSVEWPGIRWGDDCQQFVHVDRDGNLYCSMAEEKRVLASHLQPERWYHVALACERSRSEWRAVSQRVYLDGELVHVGDGLLSPKWRYLNFAQVGSGLIDGSLRGAPTNDHRGWYGFHGVVDDCRFWNGSLTADQVQQLRGGEETELVAGGFACVWSLTQDRDLVVYGPNVQRVRCARPRERFCRDVREISPARHSMRRTWDA